MKEILKKIILSRSNLKTNISFILLLIILAGIYDYQTIVRRRPQSVHHWRQSDCASLALNYYQRDMNFFHPQTHNLTSDNSTTSYSSTSEIPFWYYFIAILYKIFGYHDYIYRGANTIFFLVGLFFLFKMLYYLFNSFFWASSVTLFFFTSPILVYYGNNFLTDSSGFACVLIAWYFFFKFYKANSQKDFYYSMFFFFLAGSLKIFDLLSFTAIIIIFLIELAGFAKFRETTKLFQKPKFQFIPFVAIIAVISAWAIYAHYYNSLHQSEYFSTSIRWFSLWNVDKSMIDQVIDHVRYLWLNQFFYVPSLYFLGALFLLTMIFPRKDNKFLYIMNLLLFLGSILFIIVFFAIFRDHDCYTINMYILVVFTFISALHLLKNNYSSIFNSNILKAVFLIFLIINIGHARRQINARYNGWWTEQREYSDYNTISPYLSKIGIHPLDTVICMPDDSHFTLYLMNQLGWTKCWNNNQDSAGIALSIKRGAKYLIINGEKTLEEPYVQSYLSNQIGEYGLVKIYKLNTSEY